MSLTARLESLTFEPVGSSIEDVARRLYDGNAVGVVLEPGDMTRYNIVLVGCWAPTIRPTCVGTGDGSDFILVSKVEEGCYPVGRHAHFTSLLGRGRVTANDWTAEVLAEFLRRVWLVIDRIDNLAAMST